MAIRVAVGQFHQLTEEKLRFAAQIGVKGIQMNNPNLPGEVRWEQADVRALVERVEAHGLVFEAIENVPTHFYHKVMLGLPGRDEQIENYCHTIRAVGRAGVFLSRVPSALRARGVGMAETRAPVGPSSTSGWPAGPRMSRGGAANLLEPRLAFEGVS